MPLLPPRHALRRLAVATTTALAATSASAQGDEAVTPEVRVTVDRLKIERRESSQPVQVIDRARLEQLPVNDLSQALNTLPGVNVQRTGGPFDEGSVQMYGISGQGRAPSRTVIAIDGVPLNSGLIPETSLNMIPLAMVERIEVIQGPGSTAYGSNAFTGVINVVTRRPKGTEGQLIGLAGTRWSTSDATARFGTAAEDGSGFVQGAIQQRETTGHLRPAGREDFSDSRLRNFAGNFEKRFGDTIVSGAGLYYEYDRHNPSFVPRQIAGGTTVTSRQEDGTRQHWNVGAKHFFDHGIDAELRYSFNGAEDTSFNTFPSPTQVFTGPVPQRPPGRQSDERASHNVLGKVEWTTSINTLAVGYEWSSAYLANRLSGQRFEGITNGAFIQDRLLLLDNQLALSAGYRYDKLSTYEDPAQAGKVGFSFQPTGARWLVRGNAGHSFAAPTLAQARSTTGTLGNPNLTADSLRLYEAGIDVMPLDGLRAGLTVFTAKHINPIFPRPVGPGGQNQFVNVSPSPEYDGFMTTVDWVLPRGFNVGAAYTYNDPGVQTFHSARHTGKASVGWTGGKWTFGAQVVAAAERYWADNNQARAPDYAVMDVRAVYRVSPKLSLLATIENLFDADYATRADRQGVALGQEVFVALPRPGVLGMVGAEVRF